MKPKNIVLIAIDSLRANHLGCYGCKRNTSPIIDNISNKSILFKCAFSPSPNTIPSIPSIFTSKYPSNHSIGFNPKKKLNADIEATLASFVSSIELRKDVISDFGFEKYDDEIDPNTHGKRDCSETNYQVFNWLTENHDQDFFLFVHYSNIHEPYLIPEFYQNLFMESWMNQHLTSA